jgi:hypothetical protein
MPESPNRLSRRTNQNVLQIWMGRDALKDGDIEPLREELLRRGLSRELADMDNIAPSQDIYGPLPPPPRTYLNLTVPLFWLRELWLRYRTRQGVQVDAMIESAQRTQDGFTARAELIYSYEFQGRPYRGRVVRDFYWDVGSADSLVYDHHSAETIAVRICPDDPAISWFPSGLDALDPIVLGLRALFSWASAIAVLVVIIWELFRRL